MAEGVRAVPLSNLWIFLALYAAFWVVTSMVPYAPLNTVSQCFLVSASIAVLWVYRRPGLAALASRNTTREDHLVLGICIAWLGVLLRSGTIIVWRAGVFGNYPDAPVDSQFLNSCNYMILLGAVLHVTAPGGRSKLPAVGIIGLAVLLGAALSAAMVILRIYL